MEFSHLDKNGNAVMVNVSEKPKVRRTARAEGRIFMSPETIEMIKGQLIKKETYLRLPKLPV